MTHIDLSDAIATEMDKVLNNEENKQLFSSSSMLEKLAFTRVADEEKKTEVEEELEGTVKTAAAKLVVEVAEPVKPGFTVFASVSTLLKLSEELDTAGFERLAAASLLLAEKLVAEAKAKKSKDSKKSEKSKESSKEKSKSKKLTREERMKKMRDMKKKKDSVKKKSK